MQLHLLQSLAYIAESSCCFDVSIPHIILLHIETLFVEFEGLVVLLQLTVYIAHAIQGAGSCVESSDTDNILLDS